MQKLKILDAEMCNYLPAPVLPQPASRLTSHPRGVWILHPTTANAVSLTATLVDIGRSFLWERDSPLMWNLRIVLCISSGLCIATVRFRDYSVIPHDICCVRSLVAGTSSCGSMHAKFGAVRPRSSIRFEFELGVGGRQFLMQIG